MVGFTGVAEYQKEISSNTTMERLSTTVIATVRKIVAERILWIFFFGKYFAISISFVRIHKHENAPCIFV